MLVNNEVGTSSPSTEIAALVRERRADAALSTPTRCRRCRGSTSRARRGRRRPRRGLGAQVRRPEGHRACSSCADGVALEPLHRRRRPGAGAALGHVERRRRGGDGRRAARHRAAQRDADVARIGALRDRLVDGLLAAIPDTFENGDRAAKVAGNAHVGFRGVEAEALLVALDQRRRLRRGGFVVLVGRHRAVARARRDGRRRDDALVVDPAQPRRRVDRARRRPWRSRSSPRAVAQLCAAPHAACPSVQRPRRR